MNLQTQSKYRKKVSGTKIQICFILGSGQRSGTNFLYRLMELHPNLCTNSPIREDFFIHNLTNLKRYVEVVHRYWNPKWEVDEKIGSHRGGLEESLGRGLAEFARSTFEFDESSVAYFLTKTPSVRNLNLVSNFFPNASVIVVVRDGRDQVESGMRSFGWDFERSAMCWAGAAKEIMAMESKGEIKLLRVRYEDLFNNTERELKRVLDYLGLDSLVFDFKAAANLDVWGSSETRENGSKVHWSPRKKDSSFQPICRWKKWGNWRQQRFHWIAGKYLEYFDYEPKGTVSFFSLPYQIIHRFLDMIWQVRQVLFNIITLLKGLRNGDLEFLFDELKSDLKRF